MLSQMSHLAALTPCWRLPSIFPLLEQIAMQIEGINEADADADADDDVD